MAAPQVTPLPEAPQRNDSPADFIVKADAHVAALDTWTDEVNAVSTAVNDNAINALASENASASSATESANSSEISASNANFLGEWDDLTGALTGPPSDPASVFHDNRYWQLLNALADVTASEPGVTADWEETLQPGKVNRLSGGGAIDKRRTNIVTDGAAYDLPPASDLNADEYILIEQPSRYAQLFEPDFDVDGSDTIEGPEGTTAQITFGTTGLQTVRFTSDGISEWTV